MSEIAEVVKEQVISDAKMLLASKPGGNIILRNVGIFKSIFGYIGKIFNTIGAAIHRTGWTWLRPFFFSKNHNQVVAPYVYCFIAMILLFTSIIVFLWVVIFAIRKILSGQALPDVSQVAIILSSLAVLIGTLIVFMNITLGIYNNGKQITDNNQPKAPGVSE